MTSLVKWLVTRHISFALIWDFTQRALIVNFRRFGQPIGPTFYQATLCNVPEVRISHLHSGESCKWYTISCTACNTVTSLVTKPVAQWYLFYSLQDRSPPSTPPMSSVVYRFVTCSLRHSSVFLLHVHPISIVFTLRRSKCEQASQRRVPEIITYFFDFWCYPAWILIRTPVILTEGFSAIRLFPQELKLQHGASFDAKHPKQMKKRCHIKRGYFFSLVRFIDTNHQASKLKWLWLSVVFRRCSGSTLVRKTDCTEFLGRRLQSLHSSSQSALLLRHHRLLALLEYLFAN